MAELKAKKRKNTHRNFMLWTVVLGLVFGMLELGMPLEQLGQTSRDKILQKEVSGDIVLVGIDDQAVREVGVWPWPRSQQAKLLSSIDRQGADRIFVDVHYAGPTTPVEDQALVDTLAKIDDVVIGSFSSPNEGEDWNEIIWPQRMFSDVAEVGSLTAQYDYRSQPKSLPYAVEFDGKRMEGFSTLMAEFEGPIGKTYQIDYSLNPYSIPYVSAADLMAGRNVDMLAGKTVVVGADSEQIGDRYMLPGYKRMGGVYAQILGAETLKIGPRLELGWIAPFVVAVAALLLALRRRNQWIRPLLLLTATGGVIIAAPIATEIFRIGLDIVPALFVLALGLARILWMRWKQRGLVNELTGLPNLVALRRDKSGQNLPMIAARIHNYAEIASTLDADGESRLVEQIAGRLGVGRRENGTLYQGDEGIFIWFADKQVAIGNHLEALHALFRSAVTADAKNFDVDISFGVEVGSGRSLSNRLGSALVAADEAHDEGIKWKYFDPSRHEDATWRLSLLSELDKAIDNGEVTLAYQPKLDLKANKIIGAEALARWTHPEKGPISPTEFIGAAETHDRIGKLTDYVLDQAIAAAARFCNANSNFSVAVNLSARILTDRSLPRRIFAKLQAHGVAPEQLVLELTETAALEGTGADLDLLAELRQMGVKISIDDYGTGLSTLEYLKKVPASELKIDQSFVRGMRDNRSDLIMVQSTIALAHSLNRKVVAEGVEDRESLDQLKSMACDIAQGFIVGRPMGEHELLRRLRQEKRTKVA
ncbi:EAL domain-containing protein [Sphingomicrobium marinum]|uniref:EAL domain-containing protein n=1 Tax=Sphingomicrobium marinum TaxID=1227950 RepID=UPI00223EFC75|nr:EAL domain-containing protein [Sphingomicrobium marinum]